jgi:FixJ family two-component response regulator
LLPQGIIAMPPGEPFTIFIVDDDAGVVRALSRLLRSHGYETQSFTSSEDFLERHDRSLPGCAVLDLSMPGLDGLELQQALACCGGPARPIVFLTGRGDVPSSVRAMKAGAVDFLIKPVDDDELLAAIAQAEERDASSRRSSAELSSIQERLSRLTPREREVLGHVVAGRLNKQIAGDLGTVEKTIKVHRARMMKKMDVRSVADLARLAEKAGVSVRDARDQNTQPFILARRPTRSSPQNGR